MPRINLPQRLPKSVQKRKDIEKSFPVHNILTRKIKIGINF